MMRKKSTILLFITIALAAYGGLQWALNLYAERQLSGKLTIDEKAFSHDEKQFRIDDFLITLHRKPARLHIAHSRAPGHTVWQSVAKESFVQAAQGEANVHEARGSFFVDNEITNRCASQYIKEVSFLDNRLEISGYLQCQDGRAQYSFVLKPYTTKQLSFELQIKDKKFNRAYITYASNAQEHFFGFGEQFTYYGAGNWPWPGTHYYWSGFDC